MSMNIEANYVLFNGNIYTMDEENHIYNSMAIKGNKIIYIGNKKSVFEYIGENTVVIDLNYKMVLPGFGDSHMHPPGTSLICKYGVDLMNVSGKNNEEIINIYIDKIIKYCDKNKDKDRIYGYGWRPSVFSGIEEENGPKKERLDELNINKPIILYSFDYHSLWLNSIAFKEFNITKDTVFIDEQVSCKHIIKDNNGELWGTLKEDAFIFVEPQKFTNEEYFEAFKEFQDNMYKFGVTNVASVFVNYMSGFMPYEIYKELIENNKLKLRVSYLENINPHMQRNNKSISISEQVNELIYKRNEENDKSDYFKIIGGKIFIDGVIDNSTAYLTSPYIDASYENKINFGYNIWGKYKSELIYAIKVLNENKLQAHFHVIGDNAVKFVLDIIEKMPKYYRNMHRNVLTHLQIVRRRDLKRISKLKLIASLQTYWDVKEPNYFEESEYKRLGERAEYEYPLKSLYDEGVLISGASDYPITEINPILAIQIGATRNICNDEEYECEQITSIDDEKYLLNGNERLSVYEMIKIFTVNAARANYIEGEVGTLEINKKADFIILDKNLLEEDLINLHKVKVIETFFDGKSVYKREN